MGIRDQREEPQMELRFRDLRVVSDCDWLRRTL